MVRKKKIIIKKIHEPEPRSKSEPPRTRTVGLRRDIVSNRENIIVKGDASGRKKSNFVVFLPLSGERDAKAFENKNRKYARAK